MAQKINPGGFILFLFTAVGAVQAQSLWNLEQAVEWAVNHHYSAEEASYRLESSEVMRKKASADKQPDLSLQGSQIFRHRFDDPMGNNPSYISGISLNSTWNIWDGGNLNANLRQKEADVAYQKVLTQQVKRDIQLQVIQVFMSAAAQKEALAFAEQNRRYTEKLVEDRTAMTKAGALAPKDLIQLKSALLQDISAEIRSRNEFRNTQELLAQVLQLPATVLPDIQADSGFWEIHDSLWNMIKAELNINQFADYSGEALGWQKKSAEQEVLKAKAQGRPRVNLNASVGTDVSWGNENRFSDQGRDNLNETISIGISVPLWDKGQAGYSAAVSEYSRKVYDARIRKNELEFRQNLMSMKRNIESEKAALEAALEVKKLTLENLQTARKQFELGALSALELRQIQQDYIKSEYEWLRSRQKLKTQVLQFSAYFRAGEPRL